MKLFSIARVLLCVGLLQAVCAQTIEEKQSLLQSQSADFSLSRVNDELFRLRCALKEHYDAAKVLLENRAEESEYAELLRDISKIRGDIAFYERHFQRSLSEDAQKEGVSGNIWESEDVTLSHLVQEFGSQNFLYVIPTEIANTKIHVHSAFNVPSESWPHLVDVILQYNGIGVREINPYTKQLYLLKSDLLAVGAVTTCSTELEALSSSSRVIHLYRPRPEHLKQAIAFVEKFKDPKSLFVHQVGDKIALIGGKEEVKRLVTLCENVWESDQEKIVKVITSSKVHPDEVVKLLKAFFNVQDGNRVFPPAKGGTDLQVFPLAGENGVAVVGSRMLVERAQEIVHRTERQVDDPFERTLYTYQCNHTSPKELAEILEKVYHSLVFTSISGVDGQEMSENYSYARGEGEVYSEDPYYSPAGGKESMMYASDSSKKNKGEKPTPFIPYQENNTLMMIVRKDVLGKLKEIIRKLDRPKKMVEIEILLCERRWQNKVDSGLNILKLGSNASNNVQYNARYDNGLNFSVDGIFHYLFSQDRASVLPPCDLTFNFLLSQEDIQVSASPSLVTINQCPATFSVTDEITVAKGVMPDDKGRCHKNYEREQYGINLTLTPTIHEHDIDAVDEEVFITLENDIVFDTITSKKDDKPEVHKRRIKNNIRVADGQMIILGGLRSKSEDDRSEKVPFLGEVPGLGKLFGTSTLSDQTTEMFIFIKPTVVRNPSEDLMKLQEAELHKRVGDRECIIRKIKASQAKAKRRRFELSLHSIFGGNDGAFSL